MPAIGQQITVGTTPVRLESAPGATARIALVIRNRGTSPVYLGGPTVASTTGLELDPGESIAVDLTEADASGLWAVAASGTSSACHTLAVGV